MDELQTASGKKFDCVYFNCVPHKRQLSIRIANSTMAAASAILENPSETAALAFDGQYVEGYAKLAGIFREGDLIRVTLEKE